MRGLNAGGEMGQPAYTPLLKFPDLRSLLTSSRHVVCLTSYMCPELFYKYDLYKTFAMRQGETVQLSLSVREVACSVCMWQNTAS